MIRDKIKIQAITIIIIIVLLAFQGCDTIDDYQSSGFRVAILHYGPVGDHGWTYEAHKGVQGMTQSLSYVELEERENCKASNVSKLIREYAEKGYEVIFCHSWDFGDGIKEVAPDFPDTIFMWGSGNEKKAPNAGTYYGRMYEVRFLTGIVGGLMTRTNNIGYAAALNTSEVVRGINAFARGVSYVNPNATVYVKWVGDWFDPINEKNTSLSLINQGCDVITHHSDSYASGEACEEQNAYFISFHSDTRSFAPNYFLTGVVWNWAPIMIAIVESVRNGTWIQQPFQNWWYGLAEDGVKLAPFSDQVPNDVRDSVEEKKQEIIAGDFQVFPGLTDTELLNMDYFESNVKEA